MPRRGASPARAASRSMRGPRLSLVWSQRDATSGLDREPDSQRPPGDQDSRTSTDDEYTTAERDTEERNAELVPATEVLPSLQPSTQAGGRILYRLSCFEEGGKGEITRYSWTPFKGLGLNDGEKLERQELAVLDVLDSVEGTHLVYPHRKSQFRHNFWNDDAADFALGVDFDSRVIHSRYIRIHSPSIKQVLATLIRYYPGFDIKDSQAGEDGELTMRQPFEPLFHYWDDLQHILDQGPHERTIKLPGSDVAVDCSPPAHEHLKTLLTTPPVQDVWFRWVQPELDRHRAGRASYHSLWLLFKPGEMVFAHEKSKAKKMAGFVVMHVTPHNGSNPPRDRWELAIWNLAYVDGRLQRRACTVSIPRFYGERDIADLPAIPIKYAPNQEKLRTQLIERGKRYYRVICDDQSYMRYNGSVIAEKAYHYEGEIIVDHQSYRLEALDSPAMREPATLSEEPEDFGGGPLFQQLNDFTPTADRELEPAQYLLLPSYVLGFALGKREWAVFDMDFVADLEVDKKNPMRYLAMNLDKKMLLEAAAIPREGTALKPWSTDWKADYVDGKGRGRVIFLHGPPGTGKTMTVELIAKKSRRPLLRLSAADIGTEEVQIEQRLVRWLDRATLWGSIVLIDEAEVYLEQRQSGHINRNALVTAFLRTMEYFSGLLFLTSNGIGLFDEAVMSRIHLAVQYERPTDQERADIWRSLFDKLEQDEAANAATGAKPSITVRSTARDVVLNKSQYATNFQLNGRDIRNLLLSAIGLARYEAFQEAAGGEAPTQIQITAKHLEIVLKNKEQFNEDYRRATGFYPDQMAAEKFVRAESGR